MPGCELLVPCDVVEFVPNGGGFASWQLSLPGSSSLAGFPSWQQAFVFDAAANPLGLVASNGLILTPGIR